MRDILKQIWRFLHIATTGPGKWLSLLLLLFVIGCQYAVIQINVRQIHWYADFYNALQKLDVPSSSRRSASSSSSPAPPPVFIWSAGTPGRSCSSGGGDD